MARPIQSTDEVVQTKAETLTGTAFVKNHLNEEVILPDGTRIKFVTTRQVFTDPAIVKGLKAVASKYGIIVPE